MTLSKLKGLLGPGTYTDLLSGVRCQADHDADLLVDALNRSGRLTRPTRADAVQPTERVFTMMLLASAMLRVCRWQQEIHDWSLATRLPDLDTACEIAERFSHGAADANTVADAQRFAVEVLVFWMTHFSWVGGSALGVDVTVAGSEKMSEDQLECFAEFLWSHRSGGHQTGGGRNDGT